MANYTLKVCFVLDCTASMGDWIHAAKTRFLDLLDDLRVDNKNFKILVAFIGYRDFDDPSFKMNFTDDYTSVYDSISYIHALGGGDQAEDVAGAYRWVNELDWQADVKSVFHITDAPNHGMTYHSHIVTDDHPQGHPTIDLRDEVQMMSDKGIDLTVFRLNNTTDRMYSIMNRSYTKANGFRIIDFVNSGDSAESVFYNEVSSQLNLSMTMDPTE